MPEENTAQDNLQTSLPSPATEEDWFSETPETPEVPPAAETPEPEVPPEPAPKEPEIPDEPAETPERSRLGHRQKKVETEVSELKKMFETFIEESRASRQPAQSAQPTDFNTPLPDRDNFETDTEFMIAIADWRDAKKEFGQTRQVAVQQKYQSDFTSAYARMRSAGEVDDDLDIFLRSPDASSLYNATYTGDPAMDIRIIAERGERLLLKKKMTEKVVPLRGDNNPPVHPVTPTAPVKAVVMPKIESPIAQKFADQLRSEGWTEDDIAVALAAEK